MQGTTFLEPLILRRPPRSLDLLPDGGAEVLNRAAAAIRASNTRPGTIWPFPQGWPVISPLLKAIPHAHRTCCVASVTSDGHHAAAPGRAQRAVSTLTVTAMLKKSRKQQASTLEEVRRHVRVCRSQPDCGGK